MVIQWNFMELNDGLMGLMAVKNICPGSFIEHFMGIQPIPFSPRLRWAPATTTIFPGESQLSMAGEVTLGESPVGVVGWYVSCFIVWEIDQKLEAFSSKVTALGLLSDHFNIVTWNW